MTELVEQAGKQVGIRGACRALAVSRASYYRWTDHRVPRPPRPRSGGRALSELERQEVLDVLHDDRFVDLAVPQVHAQLLDDDERYICSVRTMYRILDAAAENRERRNIRSYPELVKPELLATRPNELWSWDISVPQKAAREMRDRPLAIGLQEQVANHRKRLGSKALVVSVAEKAP